MTCIPIRGGVVCVDSEPVRVRLPGTGRRKWIWIEWSRMWGPTVYVGRRGEIEFPDWADDPRMVEAVAEFGRTR